MGFGRVPEMCDPGEYRKGGIKVSTRKGIWVSARKVESRRVPKMWDLGEY